MVDVFDTKLGKQIKSHMGSQKKDFIENRQQVKNESASNSNIFDSNVGKKVYERLPSGGKDIVDVKRPVKKIVDTRAMKTSSSFVGPVSPLHGETKPEYVERIKQPIYPDVVQHKGEPHRMSVSWSAGGSGPTSIPVKSMSMKYYTDQMLGDVKSVRSRIKEADSVIRDLKSSGASQDVIDEWIAYRNKLANYAGSAQASAEYLSREYPSSYVTFEKKSVVPTFLGDIPVGGMSIDVSPSDRKMHERRSWEKSSLSQKIGRAGYVGFTQWPDIVVSPALRIITTGRERTIWNIGDSVKDWQSDIITRESQTWGMVGRGDMGGFATSTLMSPAVMEAGFSAAALGASKLVGTAFKGIGSKVGSRVVGKGVRGYQRLSSVIPEESFIGRGFKRVSTTEFGDNVYNYATKGFRPVYISQGLKVGERFSERVKLGDDVVGSFEYIPKKTANVERKFVSPSTIKSFKTGTFVDISFPKYESAHVPYLGSDVDMGIGPLKMSITGKRVRPLRFGKMDISIFKGEIAQGVSSYKKFVYGIKSNFPYIDVGTGEGLSNIIDDLTGLPINRKIVGTIDIQDISSLKGIEGYSTMVSKYKRRIPIYETMRTESGSEIRLFDDVFEKGAVVKKIDDLTGLPIDRKFDLTQDIIGHTYEPKYTRLFTKKMAGDANYPKWSMIKQEDIFVPHMTLKQNPLYYKITSKAPSEVSQEMFEANIKYSTKWKRKLKDSFQLFKSDTSGSMGLTQEVSFRNLSLTKKNIFSKNVPTKHFTRLDLIKGLHLPKYNKVDESFMNIFINSLSVGSGVGLTGGFKKIVEPNVVYKPSSISKSKVGLTPGLKPVFMTKSENEFEEFFMPFVDTGMGVKSDVDLDTATVTPQRQSMDTMFPPVVYPVSVVVKPVKSTFINPPAMKAASGGIVPPVLPFPKGLGGWGTSGYPDLDDFKLRYSLKRFKADPYRYVSPFKNKKVIRRIGF